MFVHTDIRRQARWASWLGGLLTGVMLLAGCGGATQTGAPAAAAPTSAPAAAAAAGVSFKSDVMPILSGNCTGCHGANGGLSLATYADVMKGGKDGAVVKVGDADNSLLVQKVKGTQTIGARMPRGGTPLTDDKIKVLSDWVAQGAKDN